MSIGDTIFEHAKHCEQCKHIRHPGDPMNMTREDYERAIAGLCEEGQRLCVQSLNQLLALGKFKERGELLKALIVAVRASEQAGEVALSGFLRGMVLGLPKRWMSKPDSKSNEPN